MVSVREVKRRHERRLMRIPGVVGVGLGLKDGRDCICVYVAEQSPRILAALPKSLEEVPVEVVVSGPFQAR